MRLIIVGIVLIALSCTTCALPVETETKIFWTLTTRETCNDPSQSISKGKNGTCQKGQFSSYQIDCIDVGNQMFDFRYVTYFDSPDCQPVGMIRSIQGEAGTCMDGQFLPGVIEVDCSSGSSLPKANLLLIFLVILQIYL